MVPPPNRALDQTANERDRLVLEHLHLARAIAIRVYENLPVHVDLDDLIHAGVLGLFDAALRFDQGKQVSFQSYAKHRIRGAILDSLREMDWASRDMRRRHKKLEQITQEVAAKLDRAPTEQEIADAMGMDIDRWRHVAIDLRTVGLFSASARAADDENQNTPEFPAGEALNPDVLTGQRELQSVISKAMATLPERYKMVVSLYYLNGKTMREIGNSMGINESRVSQIHRAALDQMAEHLQSVGIGSCGSLL
jgi:RNA polymerase sigma factor for flagellar operon FliA